MNVVRSIFVAVAGLLLCGCQTVSFYRQAIAGQCQILTHQHSISNLIVDPKTAPELKNQLQDVLKIREFALTDLKLPANGHYLKYVDLHRPFVVWSVYAAPELSMDPKTWWFPIIGEASYRGYFSEKGAKKYADALQKKGWDVFVGGVETYSTLGWFRDPVLSTFIDEPQADLAEIIFHELGHQRLFIADDTDFNEAFATAVAEEGVRRWLDRLKEPQLFERYRREQQQHKEFTAIVLDTVKQLTDLYADAGLCTKSKVQRKEELIEELRANHEKLKTKWGGKSPYDEWFKKPINNAKLSTVATYYELVPTFHAVLLANDNDLERFYAAVAEIAKLPADQRVEALKKAGVRGNQGM